jgi:RHS repeat-associated protein
MISAFTNQTVGAGASCAAGYQSGALGAYNESYTVNEIGNLTYGPAGAYTYPVSGANAVRPHAPTAAGGTSFTYSADGKRLTGTAVGVTTGYEWDPLDRLTRVLSSNPAVVENRMIYWPGGERAILKDATGVTLYLGGLSERRVNGSSSFNQRYYTFAGATVATQTATGTQTSGTADFLLGDVRGSVTLTARRSDASTSSQWYSAYGNTRGSQSTMGVTTRAYIGQTRDPGFQLNYLHARYQDPATGLFLSVDPLVAKAGEPYLYASGNPTTLSDPSGQCAEDNGRGKREACVKSTLARSKAVPPRSGGPGSNGLPPPPRNLVAIERNANGTSGAGVTVGGKVVEGAGEDDVDLVDQAAQIVCTFRDEATLTTGVCGGVGVGVFGWGADVQYCDFTTPAGVGASWTIGASVGIIGPNLHVGGAVMYSNASAPDDFDGSSVCISGGWGAGAGAVCLGLNEDETYSGTWQVFAGVGATLGVPEPFKLTVAHTWAWFDEDCPTCTHWDDDPTEQHYIGRHDGGKPGGFYDAGTPG